MGNFYTNFTLYNVTQGEALEALSAYRAIVSPEHGRSVVVYEESTCRQDLTRITKLATYLSTALACPVLAMLNHDDSILYFELFRAGIQIDKYDSCLEYFGNSEVEGPTGGDATKLCAAFGAEHTQKVEKILRRKRYVFAYERHRDLVNALGLPACAVGYSYDSFTRGGPYGLDASDFKST